MAYKVNEKNGKLYAYEVTSNTILKQRLNKAKKVWYTEDGD